MSQENTDLQRCDGEHSEPPCEDPQCWCRVVTADTEPAPGDSDCPMCAPSLDAVQAYALGFADGVCGTLRDADEPDFCSSHRTLVREKCLKHGINWGKVPR